MLLSLMTLALWAGADSDFSSIRRYIKQGWKSLMRSNATLMKSAADSKVGQSEDVILYVPASGIASAAQAARVAANLPVFERPGGLQTSDNVTGDQWDAPFGWAPMQVIAVGGLRRYGYADAADRISVAFLSMILKDFAQHGTIVEKYDVVSASSDLAAKLKFGYESNEIGFGWTNAAVLVLYEGMSPQSRDRISHSEKKWTPFASRPWVQSNSGAATAGRRDLPGGGRTCTR